MLIEEAKQMPEWLTTGITYIIPKSEDTKDPNVIGRLPFIYYV
jgi:hypothetical protein